MNKKFKNLLLATALALGIGSMAVACTAGGTTERIIYDPDYVIENDVESLDVDAPAYQWERQVAYGEEPDLNNVIIDGKATENENWENQRYYQVATSESPYVNFRITTQFSDKGLYVYAICNDGAKIAWSGRNYMFRNSNFNIYVTGMSTTKYNSEQVKSVKVDKNNMYPNDTRVKVAINSEISSGNDPDILSLEFFLTWEELRLDGKPDKVRIYPAYSYKYASTDKTVTQLAAPFIGSYSELSSYITFDESGYANCDADGALVGDSYFGLGKTVGWDITKERDADPSVTSTAAGSQAIFFTQSLGRFFSVETDIDVSEAKGKGSAGLVFFISNSKYLTFCVNKNDQTANASGFTKFESVMKLHSGNTIRTLDFPAIAGSGRAKVKVIYLQGKMYFIVNDELVHCETNNTLSERMSPGLMSIGLTGAKFCNYYGNAYTKEQTTAEALKYAYALSGAADKNLTISFDSEAVNKNVSTNSAHITVGNAKQISFNNADFDALFGVRDGNEEKYDKALNTVAGKLFKVSQVFKTVSNVVDGEIVSSKVDITNDFAAKASKGVYEMTAIDGDTSVEVKQTTADASNLAVLTFSIVDESTRKKISASPSITVESKDNGLAAKYAIAGKSGKCVVVLEKGYEYTLSVSCPSYRIKTIEIPTVTESKSINETTVTLATGDEMQAVLLTPNKLGGKAYCEDPSKSTFSVSSSTGSTWDYSHESEGYTLFETTRFSEGTVYFSGYTVDKCQIAEFTVRNTTNSARFDRVEPDPAVGFVVMSSAGSAFIGFRQSGLRVLKNFNTWDPIEYKCNLGQTVDLVNNKPYNGTWSLRMIRIEENCYMFARKDNNPWKYIQYVPLDRARSGGYAAIGLNITVSYGLSLTFTDYDIRCGFSEAETAALTQFAAKLQLGDTCFENGDLTKPLISISGTYDYDSKDGVDDNVVFMGKDFTVKLNKENCDPDDLENKLYVVTIGSQVIYLSGASEAASSVSVTLEEGNIGKKEITIEKVNNTTLTGKIYAYKEGKDITNTLSYETLSSIKGYAVSQASGARLPLDIEITGDEGDYELNYTVKVKARDNYTINVELPGYACEEATVKSGNAGLIKLVNNSVIHDMPIGGNAEFGGKVYYSDTKVETFGYNNAVYGITGPYLEVYGNIGNNYHVFNDSMLGDFVVKYSYFRVSVSSMDEPDPGVGLSPTNGAISEQIMFLGDGVRIRPYNSTWEERIEKPSLSNTNLQDKSGAKYDFMFVRRGSVYYMYSKPASSSEYTLVYTYTTNLTIGNSVVRLVFSASSSKDYHFFIYNVEAKPISDLPESATCDVTFNDAGTHTISGAHKDKDNNTVFMIGDTVTVGVEPPEGQLLAYVKINGKFVNVSADNTFTFTVTRDLTIDVEYEEPYESRQITGTVKYADGIDKTLSSVDLVFEYSVDGRPYTFLDVPVAADGSFSVSLRDGLFNAYAYKDAMTSRLVEFSVAENHTQGPNIVIDVYDQGSVTLNGKTLKSSTPYNDEDLQSEGGLHVPGRMNGSMYAYLPATATSSDYFYAETNIKMGGGSAVDGTNPYFTNDHVTGIALSTATTKIAFLFWSGGLRICSGGWSDSGYMMQYTTDRSAFFVDSDSTIRTHKLAIANVADELYVFIDDELVLTMNPTDGVTTKVGRILATSGNDNANANLSAILGDVLSGECCLSYGANISMSEGHYNKALFYDTIFTTSEQIAREKVDAALANE